MNKRFLLLQWLVAVVLVFSTVSPTLVQASDIEQLAEQAVTETEVVAVAQTAADDATLPAEEQQQQPSFSEQNETNYAVFDEQQNTVSVRVEGYKGQILYERALPLTEEIQNAAQATKAALEKHNIPFTHSATTDYFNPINGEAEKALGVGSGWMYAVNGTFPDVYASATPIQAGDVIEWHYINAFNVMQNLEYPDYNLVMYSGADDVEQITFNPIIDMPQRVVEGTDVTINVTGMYNTLTYFYTQAEGSSKQTIPLNGVNITVGDNTYTTNEQGIATIPASELTTGDHELLFTKDLPGTLKSDEGDKVLENYPRILRTYKTLTVEEKKEATVTVKGATSTIVRATTIDMTEDQNALTVLKALLTAQNIPFTVTESSFGPYVEAINGEVAGTYNGWDGWSYKVNGEAPDVGLGSYTLEPSDTLEVYYGTYPVFETTDVVETQTATIHITLKGDEFKAAAATLSNWSVSHGVVKAVTLNEERTAADVTIKLRDLNVTEEAPLTINVKGAALLGKQATSFTVQTAETITADVLPTYTAAEVREQTIAAAASAKAYLVNNAEVVSKRASSSYSGFWMYATLIAAGIDPATYVYDEATSPYAEGSSWLTPLDKAQAAVNANAGTILGATYLGLDPTNVKARNIVADLLAQQQENGGFGAINNEAFALLALDLIEAPYDQAKHLEAIMALQNEESGIWEAWGSLDSTGWALMALAPHKENPAVKAAIDKAVAGVHAHFTNNGYNNANSGAAIISGLASVGEDVFSTKWTDWEGNQLVLHLVEDYQLEDGSFKWKTTDAASNLMATEQAIIAIHDALQQYSSFSKQAYDRVTAPVEPETPVTPEVPTEPETPVTPEVPTEPETPVTPAEQTMSVTVSITGVSPIVTGQTITVKKDATALQVLQQVASANNVSLQVRETTFGQYVEGIAGLMEMQYGKTSGWTYHVNGVYPEHSADREVLSAGDTMAWVYVYETTTPTPTVPTAPTPVEPSEPEMPTTPEEPTTPETPVTPEEPTEPETPTQPEQPVEVDVPFTDIKGLASAPYIAELYARNITTGTTATTFAPTASLTRSQFAVMVARALALKSEKAIQFTDVQGKWYADAVQALVEAGIVQGTSATTFEPGNTITRQQTAVMLYRVLQYGGYTEAVTTAPQFKDSHTISAYAQTAFATLQQLGILTGNEAGFANPHEQLTRQQMAKLLILTLQVIEQ